MESALLKRYRWLTFFTTLILLGAYVIGFYCALALMINSSNGFITFIYQLTFIISSISGVLVYVFTYKERKGQVENTDQMYRVRAALVFGLLLYGLYNPLIGYTVSSAFMAQKTDAFSLLLFFLITIPVNLIPLYFLHRDSKPGKSIWAE